VPEIATATISLAMAAWNRERFIPAAIGSILRQTRTDWELVVWDDGSTDGTVAAAERAAGGDPRIRIVRGEHAGVSRSLNAAAKLCRGPYFGWVDSDDGLAPTALEATAAVLDADPSVGLVYSDYLTMDEGGNIRGPGSRTGISYSRDRLLIDFMTFQFRLMRRELFDRAGGLDQALDGAEDYDLCLRLSELTEFRHLPRPLYFYRVHPSSVSVNDRLRQIMASREAIARALKRRGMDDAYEIDVELVGRFKLKRRRPPEGTPA
jgi:glycosyltransferase involved in cell wall biosynthesis